MRHVEQFQSAKQRTVALARGLHLDPDLSAFLRGIDIDVAELRQAAIAELGTKPKPVGAKFPLDIEQIPLRRGVLDVVSFRSMDKVRERLFGPASNPDKSTGSTHSHR